MKKLILLFSALSLLTFSSLSSAASLPSQNKMEVTKQFQDKTISTIPLVTINDTLVNNTFTGYFAKDGTVKGQFATKPDNADISDTGKWKVNSDGSICVTWDHWYENKPICVMTYKVANGLILINQKTKNFETMILSAQSKQGDQLS